MGYVTLQNVFLVDKGPGISSTIYPCVLAAAVKQITFELSIKLIF